MYRSSCEEHIREGGGAITEENQILPDGGDDTISGDVSKTRLDAHELC